MTNNRQKCTQCAWVCLLCDLQYVPHVLYIADVAYVAYIVCILQIWTQTLCAVKKHGMRSQKVFFCDLASMWTSSYLSVGCPKEHNMIITLVTAGAHVGEMWVMLGRCELVPTLVSKVNMQAIRVKWTLLVCCWMDIANQRQAWCKYAVNMQDIRHYWCVVVRTLCPKAYPGVSCQCIPMVE